MNGRVAWLGRSDRLRQPGRPPALLALELEPVDHLGIAIKVIAGTTDLGSVNVAGLIGFINSGAAKALVQTGAERWPDLSDVPTMEQAGIPNAVVETSQMLLAPAGTPQPIIDRLAKEVLAIMHKPDVRERMLNASFAVQPEGPDQLRARIAREVPMWKELVERSGIKIE